MRRSSSVLARATLAVAVVVATAAAAIVFAAGDDRSGGAAPQRGASSWGSLAPSPLERTEVGAARIGDRVFVVGGYISSGGTTDRMARYDISENRWKEVAPLPIQVNHPGVAALGGRLYVYGGNLPGGGAGEPKSRRLYRYSPRGDRWQRLADAPTARAAMGFVGVGRKLYAAGGYTETNDRLRTLEIYDLRRDRWQRGPKMPTGRNHVGAVAFRGSTIVTGGRPGPASGGRREVEIYVSFGRFPLRDRWVRAPRLRTARSGHVAVAARDGVVVFGGEELGGGSTIEEVEFAEPRDFIDRGPGAWEALPDMVTPRHGLGAVAYRGRIYAIEGGPQPGLSYSNAVEFLDLP